MVWEAEENKGNEIKDKWNAEEGPALFATYGWSNTLTMVLTHFLPKFKVYKAFSTIVELSGNL